jgi:hypothetical protein
MTTTQTAKAPTVAAVGALRTRQSITESTQDQKRLATIQAHCALAGVVLHQIDNDHGKTVYIVSRWALTRELADLDAVSVWLEAVTGVKP